MMTAYVDRHDIGMARPANTNLAIDQLFADLGTNAQDTVTLVDKCTFQRRDGAADFTQLLLEMIVDFRRQWRVRTGFFEHFFRRNTERIPDVVVKVANLNALFVDQLLHVLAVFRHSFVM